MPQGPAEAKRRGSDEASFAKWRPIELDIQAARGRWLRLTFSGGFLASPRRPQFRIVTADGEVFSALPSPSFGRAIWYGLIPQKARSIWIRAAEGAAPEAIQIESLEILPWIALPSYAPRRGRALFAFALKALRDDIGANRQFRRALMSTPLSDYRAFRERRRRAPDWEDFDRSTLDVTRAPKVRVLAPRRSPEQVQAFVRERREPEWLRWDVAANPSSATLSSSLSDLAENDVVLVADPQTKWETEALAAICHAFLEDPVDVLYVDEASEGAAPQPLLKPDWSPVLAQSQDLIGRGWAASVGWLRRRHGEVRFSDCADLVLRPEAHDRVRHLARVLRLGDIRRRRAPAVAAPPRMSASPCVSIVIPTKDRVDLLRRCVDSLAKAGCQYEAIIVDNGSVEGDALAYLAALERRPGFRVSRQPGPFNFSGLCNRAAALAGAETLLFLNNDAEARSEGWLAALVAWAGKPSVGAVGAKLLYPNGTLQHGGVVIGVDGHANHFERRLSREAPGYFERLALPHEVSAVTGACLAVEKHKFLAVGGFDEVHLPVEFSDVDLCMRLAERGWTCLIEPRSVLVHHEGATRKISRDQERRYADQVRYFKTRWADRLIDDPYFHPQLSLDWHTPALA